MRLVILTLFALLLPAGIMPATAQNQAGALSYTALGAQKTEGTGHMLYRRLDDGVDDSAKDKKEGGDPEQKQEADKVWEKYKALAAGTYKDKDEEDTKRSGAERGESDSKSADAEAAQPTSGLASILEEYKKAKSQRSQMHVIQVTPEAEFEAEENNSDEQLPVKKKKKKLADETEDSAQGDTSDRTP